MTKVNFYDSIDDSMLKLQLLLQNIMENGYSVSIEKEVHGKCREDIENKVRIFLKQQRENCMRKQEPLILR